MTYKLGALLAALLLAPPAMAAEPSAKPATGLSLAQAVDYADANYASVKAALEERTAADRNVDVARAAYLPQVNLLYQVNRATVNNITGVLLPQGVIPSISGPVLPSSGKTDWNTGAGVLLDWKALDFGVRGAHVAAAREAATAARDAYELTRIDVVAATTDAYLNVLAAQALTAAAQADVDRLREFQSAVHVLLSNRLRAGVDAEQADAAESLGEARLAGAQANLETQRAILARLVRRPAGELTLDDPRLGEPPLGVPADAVRPIEDHPAARQALARARQQDAELKAVGRSYAPQVDVLASASERGGGKTAAGAFLHGDAGLDPDTRNWAVGVQVTLPIGSYPALHAQQGAQRAAAAAARDRYEQTLGDLGARLAQAQAELKAAQTVAKLAPAALEAARAAETQQRARYKSGLASAVDMTAAEAALSQAEAQDAVARLNVWRAWAAFGAAAGDLGPFRAMIGPR